MCWFEERNLHHVQTIVQAIISQQLSDIEHMPSEVKIAIKALARDEAFQAALQRRREYHLLDNTDL